MGFVALGLFYGIIMLKNQHSKDALYFVGHWSFRGPKQAVYWLLAIVVIVGVPTALLAMLLPFLLKSAILRFILTALGATYGGFAFVYLIGYVQNHYGWMEYR